MGRYIGHHTYRYTVSTIYQKIGHSYGKYLRLIFRSVKIRYKIHHIFIKIRQEHFLGKFFQLGFGISHGSGTVSLYGSEIAMTIHKCHTFFKILGHNYKSLINGTVPVRMILTHGITNNTRGLPVRFVRIQSQLIHGIKYTPLDRLESVTYIR